jgi:hypothetical protein
MFGNCRLIVQLIATLCLGLNARSMAGSISPDVSFMIADETGAWTSSELTYQIGEPMELPLIEDDSFTPAQMLSPQRPLGLQTAQRQQRPQNQQRESGLASVPFMIGDTGAGSCISYGSFLDVELGHPTLACGRLNVAEANTPLPIDRLYYSYRHFANATPTRVFQYSEDFDVDRHTLAGERTFFNEMMSMEIRVPIEYRLNSQSGTYAVNAFDQTIAAPAGFDPIFGFGSDRQAELGNVSMIFKALLMERRNFAMSVGLGVTLPTAKDVTYDATIDEYITFQQAPFLARYAIQLSSIATNETVYLAPYSAWIYQPNERFFHQGFLQIETPANDSFFLIDGGGLAAFDTNNNGIVSNNFPDPGDTQYGFITPFPVGFTKLQPQTLMRLNLGWGYVLSENARANWIQKLTGLFEVHYTSTLNDATFGTVQLITLSGSSITGLDTITVGNKNNRVDIVNLTTGVTANMGNWVMTHGFTAPVKDCECSRGFDFEYNLQMQRPF